jgi:transposase
VALKGRRATFAERVSACEAIERGQSPDLVAEVSGFSRSSVFAWWRTYRKDGPWALQTRKTRGPVERLSEQQMVHLYLYLLLSAEGRRRPFLLKLWTREMVADLIDREFGITLSLVTVSRVLERMGMAPPPRLHRPYGQDPEKTQWWKEAVFPEIRTRAKAKDAAIFFADEASIRTDYDASATMVPGTGVRRSVWMTSAVRPRREVYFTIHQGEISAEGFTAFCTGLMSHIGRPVFLILTDSYIHRAELVNRFAADHRRQLTLFFLPRYSPELNLV